MNIGVLPLCVLVLSSPTLTSSRRGAAPESATGQRTWPAVAGLGPGHDAGVYRYVQLTGDLPRGEIGGQVMQHPGLAVGEGQAVPPRVALASARSLIAGWWDWPGNARQQVLGLGDQGRVAGDGAQQEPRRHPGSMGARDVEERCEYSRRRLRVGLGKPWRREDVASLCACASAGGCWPHSVPPLAPCHRHTGRSGLASASEQGNWPGFGRPGTGPGPGWRRG
jgi:hypothetical protein